jgi:hypothetical protein
MLFKKQPLALKGCKNEPEGIIWENQNNKGLEKCCRCVCMWSLIVLTIAVVFVFIFLASLFVPRVQVATDIAETVTLATAKASGNSTIVDLYCLSQSLSSFTDQTILTLCSDYLRRFVIMTSINLGVSVTIVVLNVVLRLLVTQYGKIRRYLGHSELLKSRSLGIFLAVFLNTFVLTIILYSNFWGFSFSTQTVKLLEDTNLRQFITPINVYSDLERNWYIGVGYELTVLWIISTFSPHMIELLLVPLMNCWRERKAGQAQLQEDMNANSIGPEFDLSVYLSDVLQYMCISFVLASLMPHMAVLGLVGFVLKYWVYKYLLLRYNKRPPSLDHRVIQTTFFVIPFTIVLHVMLAIWGLGYTGVFPIESSLVYAPIRDLIGSTSQQTLSIFANYQFLNVLFTRALTQVIFTCILALLLFYMLAKYVFYNVLAFLVNLFCGAKEESKDPPFSYDFEEVLDKIEGNMLLSYDMRKNPEYAAAAYSIDASL